MPEVPPEETAPGLKTKDIPRLFRVATFYNICVKLLEEGLNLVLLPFDKRDFSVLAELVPVLFLLGGNRQWLVGV
jgi:hypothetical protein